MVTTKIANWNLYGTDGLSPTAQRVYTRALWSHHQDPNDPGTVVADDWVLQPNLWCERVNWALLPTIGSASFVHYFGFQHPHSAVRTDIAYFDRLNVLGHWVKVEFDCSDLTITWYGQIEEEAEEQGGLVSQIGLTERSGRQTFVATSMAQVFNKQIIDNSMWLGHDNEHRRAGIGIPFNQKGRPNRTISVQSPYGHHCFMPTAPRNRWNEQFPDEAQWWSSRDIFQYTVLYHRPRDRYFSSFFAGTPTGMTRYALPGRMPVVIENLHKIPNWDRPTIQTEGRSVLSVMNQIVGTTGLLQTEVDVNEVEDGPDEIVVRVHSLAPVDIDLPNGQTFPRGDFELEIEADRPDTHIVIQRSLSSSRNSITVKGARAQTILTGEVTTDGTAQSEDFLGEGWSTSDETAYNDGNPTGEDINEIVANNSKARKTTSTARVYKTFIVMPNWDYLDANGDNVFLEYPNAEDVNEALLYKHIPYYNEMKVQVVLPLREGEDYGSIVMPTDDPNLEYRKPYVLLEDPFDSGFEFHYVETEKMSDGALGYFSARSSVWNDGMGLNLDVLGGNQHVIAASRFVPNLGDDPLELVAWDYMTGLFTLALMDDRHAEAQLVDPDVVNHIADHVTMKNIYTGDELRQIRMMDQTVVDVMSSGAAVKTRDEITDGRKFIRDDYQTLLSLATIAAIWHASQKTVLRLSSALPLSTPRLGDLVVTCNTNAIYETITQISINHPLGLNLQVGSLTYTLETARGEADIIQFAPAPPVNLESL